MMSPWCVRLMPQPDSVPELRHHRSWKLGAAPAVPPTAHVGTAAAKTWRVIGFDTVAPFTVAVNVPVLPSLKVKDAVPTGVETTCCGLKAPLKAGPVVRYSVPL